MGRRDGERPDIATIEIDSSRKLLNLMLYWKGIWAALDIPVNAPP
jgi:hypothetical protein